MLEMFSEKYNFQHKFKVLGSEIDLVVIIGFACRKSYYVNLLE